MKFRPVGLHGTCLQVRYMPLCRAALKADAMKPSILKTVAGWRVHQPEQFAELCGVLGIAPPTFPTESRTRRRPPVILGTCVIK